MRYRVLTPFTRMTPTNGFESYTHGDSVEIDDAADAGRMVEAGILERLIPAAKAEPVVETADLKPGSVENAVKTKKAK